MKKVLLLLLTVQFTCLTHAQTWDGSSGSDWNSAANWSTNAVPIATATVIIPSGVPNNPQLTSNVTIGTLNMSSGSVLDFNGFTITANTNFIIASATLNNTNIGTDINITSGGTGTRQLGGCIINDNIIITCTGTGTFLESVTNANTYNGNCTINVDGGLSFTSSNTQPSVYNGNFAINRSVAGTTNIFNNGHGGIIGNFSYTNTAGGVTEINNFNLPTNAVAASIGGTVSISVSNGANFTMRRVKNNTAGGIINVSATVANITNDTLLLNSITVSGITGAQTDNFDQLQLNGDLLVSDLFTNTGNFTFGRSIINGNTSFTLNGTSTFSESSLGTNTYNGNTTININNTSLVNTSNSAASIYNGNFTISRSVAGTTNIFNNGHGGISGNFSYTNTAGGVTDINNSNLPTNAVAASIGGTVNIIVSNGGAFAMRRVINNTAGGTINISTTFASITNDTLNVSSMTVSGMSTAQTDIFDQLQITGNLIISDLAANGSNFNFGRSVINGNTTFTLNSAAPFAESSGGANMYNGDAAFICNSTGAVTMGTGGTPFFNGSLIFNTTTGLSFSTTNKMVFGGNANTMLEQLGTQALTIPRIEINKTAAHSLTLNNPVTLTTALTFTTGNIISSTTNYLQFAAGCSHTGASASSKIIGEVRKAGSTSFTFPVGTANSFNAVAITAPAVATDVFSADYKNTNPTANGYDTAQRAPILLRVSGCEYWMVNRVAGTSNVTLTFSFQPPCAGNANYISSPSAVSIARWTGGGSPLWENLGNGGSTGTTTGTVTTAAPITNFSPFTFASTNLILASLPLHLLSFTAVKESDKVNISWKTSQEINVSHFEIQRSVNGAAFNTIATLPAKNTQTENQYNIYDNNPVKGNNFYRLKTVDKDSRSNISDILKIDFTVRDVISITPNPAKSYFVINGADKFKQLQLVDVNGKLVKQFNKNYSNRYDVSDLLRGIYLLQLINDQEMQVQKILIQ